MQIKRTTSDAPNGDHERQIRSGKSFFTQVSDVLHGLRIVWVPVRDYG